MKKIFTIIIFLLLLNSFFFMFFDFDAKAVSTPTPNFDGQFVVYTIGTSISCGHNGHDPDPNYIPGAYAYADIRECQYQYKVDQHMLSDYGIVSNLSAWFTNASGWDIYNLAYGASNTPISKMPDRLNGTDSTFNSNRQGWRIPADPDDIDILIMEGGHHGKDAGQTPDEINSYTYDLYNFTQDHGIQLILTLIIPNKESMHDTISGCNPWRESFAENHSGVWCADTFNNAMYDSTDGDWCDADYFYETDGNEIHPRETGYEEMAKAISKTLYEVYVNLTGTTTTPEFISVDGGTNGTSILSATPTINWSVVTNASKYYLEIDNNDDFSSPETTYADVNEYNYPSNCDINATRVSFTLPTELSANNKYYLRVKAYVSD